MKKKYISLFLALVMIFSLAVPTTLASEEGALYQDLITKMHALEFTHTYMSADLAEIDAFTAEQLEALIERLNGIESAPAYEYNKSLVLKDMTKRLEALTPDPTPEVTPEPTATPEATPETGDPTATPEVTPEPGEPTPEPTEEPTPTVYEQIMAGATTEEMLITMNGLIESDLDAVMALTFEEIDAIAQQAKALDPEMASQDTVDLLDTLTYLPNSMASVGCPDCGQMVEHAEDCPRANAAVMPSAIQITSASRTLTTGEYYLKDNVSISSNAQIKIPSGANVVIDLCGFVLAGNNTAALINVEYGGTLTIKTSKKVGHAGYVLDGRWYWTTAAEPEGAFDKNFSDGIIINRGTGGGILVAGTCNFQSGMIAGCSNGHGAAMAVTSSGILNMTGGTLTYNVATDETGGGAIYGEPSNSATNNGSQITISNATITNNTAQAGAGGGILAFNVTISNSTVSGNTAATHGGGIRIRDYKGAKNGGSLTITDCIINNNKAGNEGAGGGICVDGKHENGNIKVRISGATEIKNNTARNGGGIYAGDITITGTSGKSVVIFDNAATYRGGGIYAYGPTTIQYSTIDDNYAGIAGGGIFSSGNLTISDTKIINNRAMTTETSTDGVNGKVDYGRGGGIWVQGDGVVSTLTNVDISKNAAMYYGGGVQVCSGASLELISGKINQNEVVLKGAAGVHVTANATFTLTGGEISGNISKMVGGAIHSSYECRLYLNGGSITNNIVYGRGGGVHVNTGGNLVLNGTYIGGNKAYNGTNYISATVNSDLNTWSNVISDGSTIQGFGGGVHIDSGTCSLQGSIVSGNYAQVGGGGVSLVMLNSAAAQDLDKFYMNRVVELTVESGSITGNSTGGNGGGVYLMKNMLSAEELTIAGRDDMIAGNCVLEGIPKVTITGGSVTGNTAATNGGGIYQEGSTQFIISGGALSGNNAVNGAGVYVAAKRAETSPEGSAQISGGEIKNNIASASGAGLYINGPVTMTGGSIADNEATTNGGGVAVDGGNFTMISGAMTGNDAGSYGGGAYAKGGNITIGVKDCTGPNGGVNHSNNYTTLPHPVVSNNTADFAGGGFAVESIPGVDCNVFLYCGTIQTNTSLNNGTGMNVFMSGEGDDSVIHHYLNGTNIGSSDNHGIVVIGGKLNVVTTEDKVEIQIRYHNNYGEDEIWYGSAPKDYRLNLPYCPEAWETDQNHKNLTFVGWGHNSESTPVTGDLSYIRDEGDYKFLGEPITVKEVALKIDAANKRWIDFYAVWAPLLNYIHYFAANDNYGDEADTTGKLTTTSAYPETYTFSTITATAPLEIPVPSKPGYTFIGWELKADTTIISNWNSDGTTTHPSSVYNLAAGTGTDRAGNSWEYKNNKLIIHADRNFGYITLTALFEENPVTFTYYSNGPEGKAYGQLNPYTSGNVFQYTETIGAATGTATPVTAVPAYGYKFDGWHTDEDCTIDVGQALVSGENGVTITPNKNADGIYESDTFYALFDFHLADLYITKTATGDFADEQRYIFQVYEINPNATAEKFLTTVTIANGGSAILNDLYIGTEYKVVEVTDWSWRHDADKVSKIIEIQPNADDVDINTVAFVNTQNENRGKWLTDDDYKLNVHT